MTARASLPPAPVGQQAPPAHAATRLMGALRVARGSLLLTTGTGYRCDPSARPPRLIQIVAR